MSVNSLFDVLVVGAGPVGLTMAGELARSGVRCRIIDKLATPATTSRALGIFPRTLEMFQIMGVVEPVLEVGHQLSGVAIYNRSGQIGHIGFSNLASRYRFAISLPQSETERLLIEHLAGFEVFVDRGKELVALSQTDDAVQAVIRDMTGIEEKIETDWVIGCDGAHSSARHLLDLPFAGDAYPETFLLADVKMDGPLDHFQIHLFLAGEGLVAIFPFRGDRCRIIVSVSDEADGESAGPLRLEEIQDPGKPHQFRDTPDRPGLAVSLWHFPPKNRQLPCWPHSLGGRFRPYPQPCGWTRDEHRNSGRRKPSLETCPGGPPEIVSLVAR